MPVKRKAFTLIELLVVIGIIAVLVVVLTGLFSGSTEQARAVKCLANMRNLSAIANAIGLKGVHAGSSDHGKTYFKESQGGGEKWDITKGWLNWDDRGASEVKATSLASPSLLVSAYTKDPDLRRWCYEKGSFSGYVNGNYDIYRCPTHLVKMKKENPAWSYVMNANLGWADILTGIAPPSPAFESTNDRRLLFAELPFLGTEGETPDTSESPGFKNDCTLQFSGCGTEAEYIGFNHRSSRRMMCAHVAFCDGHVEKLVWPVEKGLTKAEVVQLTRWLCTGKSISFNGKKYEVVK